MLSDLDFWLNFLLSKSGYDLSGILEDEIYYERIGVSLSSLLKPAPTYWEGWDNPPITLDLVQALPKTDLHCNLEGSVSVDLLWQELQQAKMNIKSIIGIEIKSANVIILELILLDFFVAEWN